MNGEVEDTSSTGTKSTTGLPGTTLVAGNVYLVCAATSDGSGTLQIYSTADGLDQGPAPFGSPLVGVTGGTSAAELAQFNANCTAATTPYACCTGSGTGTCTGMPTSVPTLTAAQEFYPWLVKVGE